MRNRSLVAVLCMFLLAGANPGGMSSAKALPSQTSTASNSSPIGFEALGKWRDAVVAGDATALQAMYSADPPASVASPNLKAKDSKDEIKFWSSLKRKGLTSMEIQIMRSGTMPAGPTRVVFQAEFVTQTKSGPRKVYASVSHNWVRQGEEWRIFKTERTDLARVRLPSSTSQNLYPPDADAEKNISEALGRAAENHRRILLVFGANWCYACHVLESAFQMPEIAPVVQENFEAVHIDTGEGDKNPDLVRRYGVSLDAGIPVLAVLGSDGKVLYSQRGGEFASEYSLAPEDILAFLNRWKPKTPAR